MDIITAIKAGKKLKFLNKISSSSLKKKASQVHRMHNAKSVTIAIALFEYRLIDKIFSDKRELLI